MGRGGARVIAVAPQPIRIDVSDRLSVAGLLQVPIGASLGLVMAHGAGAGMTHPFMEAVADGLGERGVATLRYQFPNMERGLKRPDAPALAQATVRAAVIAAARLAPTLALFAGGKSFGGRMSSEAQADKPLAGVLGLVFLGFPLHPAGKPSTERALHLSRVHIPMLFLQGTRDSLAAPELLVPAIAQLGAGALVVPIANADHSFHVPARSGKTDRQILAEMLDTLAAWLRRQSA